MADDIDPIAPVSPLRAGLQLVRFVQRWIEGPDRAALYRDHYEEWVAQLAQALRQHAGDAEALAERLDALEQDRERVLVLGNYGLEAWREAVDRRRAMLGDAAVAAVLSELTAAELARVERTIRMLDPEDLDTLVALEANASTEDTDNSARLYSILADSHLGGVVLTASGCVRVVSPGMGRFEPPPPGMGPQVTLLGRLVLRFMGRSV